jgi:hypothetical protein
MQNTIAVVSENDSVIDASLDQYGRDAAERTVELPSACAEAANRVVEGESIDDVLASLKAEYEGADAQTFDEAIGYIMYRGLAEIKRQGLAAEATKAKSKLAATSKAYKAMLAVNPALVNDPTFVNKMVQALGMLGNTK